MKECVMVPQKSFNGIEFGCSRDVLRKHLGSDYREIKKSPYDRNTMDFYQQFAVFYSKDDKFEAIEFYEDVEVVVAGKRLFPATIDECKVVFPCLEFDGYGYIEKDNSIGITLNDEDSVEAILFGKENYYQ